MTGWATDQQIMVDKVVVEVGCALNGHRRKLVAVVGDASAHRMVVGHRDGLCRLGRKMYRPHWPGRVESGWWTVARSMRTWYGI